MAKLSAKIKALLENTENQIFISAASIWEIVIKKARGRLKTPDDLEGGIKEAGFKFLPIEINHGPL